ncbi:hypothetical protein C4X99_05475 [Leptospira interrogans serovar Geyaweera]|nr:hypothetical protein C4X99_05475 [Leptospira interrogans serovar Geyaweera]QCO36610.1 hypothetical protein E4412_04825 [Leptospira interrogans]
MKERFCKFLRFNYFFLLNLRETTLCDKHLGTQFYRMSRRWKISNLLSCFNIRVSWKHKRLFNENKVIVPTF